jgi:cysteine-rich repeat protein
MPACLGGASGTPGNANHVCEPGENYADDPHDCYRSDQAPPVLADALAEAREADASAGEAELMDRVRAKYPNGIPGMAPSDPERLVEWAGNGVCELRENWRATADCPVSCGDGTLDPGEEGVCLADLWYPKDKSLPDACGDGYCSEARQAYLPAKCTTAGLPQESAFGADHCARDCTPMGEDGVHVFEQETCGDATCDAHENPANCPADCVVRTETDELRYAIGDGLCTPEEAAAGERDCLNAEVPACAKLPAGCGDGEPDPGEVCDDGNNVGGDDCPADCQPDCGDGVVHAPEACDDGNDDDTDECTNACTFNATCGNGTLESGETCDEGDANADPADAAKDACTTNCEIACGDGILSSQEACDHGGNPAPPWQETMPIDECTAECERPAYCGDANVQAPDEACDNGTNDDAPWSPAPPPDPDTACAAGCQSVTWCGDGMLTAEEVCDDGNNADGDGCTADCMHEERWVFVTSASYTGDLNGKAENPDMLTGLALADARCDARAMAAGLSGTYHAWLSDGSASPSTRFDDEFVGFYRLRSDGFPIVAEGWSGLTSGALQHPIDADESGSPLSNKNVWTNTTALGTNESDKHCDKWNSQEANEKATIGFSSGNDVTWTFFNSDQLCNSTFHLYCFQDPR